MLAVFVLGVGDELPHQGLGGKNVHPHGHQRQLGVAGHGRRVGGFFQKIDDPVVLVHVQDTEGAGLLAGGRHRRHRQVRPLGQVEIQHGQVIHFIDVVAGEDKHVLGALLVQELQVLVDAVRRAPVPAVHGDLLGGTEYMNSPRSGRKISQLTRR